MKESIDETAGLQVDRAEYIERMSQELSRLAAAARLPVLAYILDMASEEAASVRNGSRLRLAPEAPDGLRRPRGLEAG